MLPYKFLKAFLNYLMILEQNKKHNNIREIYLLINQKTI